MRKPNGSEALPETNNLIQQGSSHIAQAAFEAEGFFRSSRLSHFKGDSHNDIYEVKSSSSMQNIGMEDSAQVPSKEEHILDLAFQHEVASLAVYIIDSVWLVELNKSFTQSKQSNLSELEAYPGRMKE